MKEYYPFFAFLANCATIVGLFGAIILAYIALKTYKSNNSIRKWKLIREIDNNFLQDGLYEFYDRIKKGEQIDFENHPNDEKLLNKALTLFDGLSFFQTQGLLGKKGKEDEEAWEYFASEILNYAINNSIWKYMHNIKRHYKEIGFHTDIIPFTGFPDLYENLPEKFRRQKLSRQLTNKFNLLSHEERESYKNKVRDIPEETRQLKQLKDTAAIILFANDKGWKA